MNYLELVKKLKYYNRKYYDEASPEISDEEYDKLYDAAIIVEKNQGWAAADSPSRHVGGIKGKIKHEISLYSLKKVYEQEEVDSEFSVETPKIDGTNLTLTYKGGKIFNALTRGDGEFGNDVIHLVNGIKNLPINMNTIEKLIITGEVVTDNEVENFRNYVAGALNLKSFEDFIEKNIIFLAHNLLNSELNYLDRMKKLQDLGFTTVLDDINYPTDGIVYRVNSYKREQELGYTSKHPRFAIALKPRGDLIASTVLQEVHWVVGRTGTVNPVGIIDPVIIDGATISRVTLHNIGIIEEHNLGLGDVIQIERAGGVIPKFIKVQVSSPHNHKVTQQSAEEIIGFKLRRDGPRLMTLDGKGNSEKYLNHFIKTIDIKGLGPKSVEKMKLSHPIDLFKKQNWDLLGVNGAKIKQAIEVCKKKPYHIVLAALGIPGIGKSASKKIINKLPTFSQLKDIEFTEIPSIGPVTTEKILTWLTINENWVSELPLNLEETEEDLYFMEEQSIKRKICISGKLDMTKADLEEELNKFNIIVSNSLTKDCTALIYDGDNSGKYKKAKQYGIKIINYWENKKDILTGKI